MDSKVKQQVQQMHQQEISNYLLLHVIGRGGFADVYLAQHSYLQTRVALKIFRTRPGEVQMERFLVQVRKLARLQHEHILPILSCDVRDGSPFLVMPYAPGGTLRQRHPRGSQLPMELMLLYLRQIAPALDAAHRAGQIHGDIKPENLLLGEQEKLLLSDFGLASAVENMPGRTQAPVIGTVTYMAPEQLAGQLEAASDQYALAILVYEWLCGEPPFAGTYTEVAAQHALIDPPSLRQRRPDLAPQVEQVIARALAKNPGERFSSVQAFASALEQAGSSPVAINQATKRILSRRTLLGGLVGAGSAAALGAAGLVWRVSSNPGQGALLPLYTYYGHTDKVYGLSWSPDSTRLASVDLSGTAQVWQAVAEGKTARGKLLTSRSITPTVTMNGTGDATGLAWSPRTALIALGDSPGKILVWESANRQNLFVLRDYTTLGACVAWSPDGTQLAAAYTDTQYALFVAFWDIASGNRLDSLEFTGMIGISTTFTPTPVLIAWSPDGKRIALSSGNNVTQIRALPGGQVLSTLHIGPNSLAWFPNSKCLAADNQVWDVDNGRLQHTYGPHSQAADWSPDGKYLATGGKDMRVSIWYTRSGKLVQTYQGHSAPINALRWSPDGSLIASASDDQTARIFTALFA
jgi:serine/threonine protein kinase